MATWDEVAGACGVHTRQVHRWRKMKGSPILPDVATWIEWRKQQTGGRLVTGGLDGDNVSDDAALPGGCEYDDLVKSGKITYALAKVREQVISEQVTNEAKRVELQKARGLLVSRDDAERAAAQVRDMVSQQYDRAIARALANTPSVSAEMRDAIMSALLAELDFAE